MKVFWPVAALVASVAVAVPAQAAAPVPVVIVHGDCYEQPVSSRCGWSGS